MYDTLRDALVVKAMDFLAANLILEQHGTVGFTAGADHPEPGERELTINTRKPLIWHAPVVCIGNFDAMICGQMLASPRLLDVMLQVDDLVR